LARYDYREEKEVSPSRNLSLLRLVNTTKKKERTTKKRNLIFSPKKKLNQSKMRKTAPYNCSQQELYLVSVKAWGLCRKHLPRFVHVFGYYTEGYIDDRLAEVAAAKAIPNHYTRNDAPTSNHVYLVEAIRECGAYFQILKLYIKKAFDGDLQKKKLDAAGQSFFAKAMSGNQGKLNDLNESALQFIASNTADLMRNDNMNAAFLDEYTAIIAHYNALRKTYTESKQIAQDLSKQNTVANNKVHKVMMKMLSDAKVLFRREPDLRKQFVFDCFLASVRRN
jgi:hypothetical protein